MPIYVQQEHASRDDAVNIPLELQGWDECDGNTAALGRRLDRENEGSNVAVVLTTRDKAAKNQNRRSLDEWRRGFRVMEQTFRLEIGGVVSFKACRKLNGPADRRWPGGLYVSTWPNVLACNQGQTANVVMADHAIMRVVTSQDGGRTWGDVLVCHPDIAEAVALDGVAKATAQILEGFDLREPRLLLRGLNPNGEVVGSCQVVPKAVSVSNGANKSFVFPTTAEIAELAAESTARLQQEFGSVTSVSILPAERFPLSQRAMAARENAVAMEAISRGFRERHGGAEIYVSKEAVLKLSADSGGNEERFVNATYPTYPYRAGENPDLLGGLRYAGEAGRAPRPAPERGDRALSGERSRAPEDAVRQQNLGIRGAAPDAGPAANQDPFAAVPSFRPRSRA